MSNSLSFKFKWAYKLISSVKRHLLSTFIIFLLALIFIMASLLLEGDLHQLDFKHLISKFVLEIGMAFFIAALVIITIERKQRDEQNSFHNSLMDSISRKLFTTIYKKNIPENTFKEIFEVIDNCKVFRKEHSINYSIQSPPNGVDEKYVSCEVSSRYFFENVTDSEISQDVVLFLEKPLVDSYLEFCKIEYVKVDGVAVTNEPCSSDGYVDSDHATTFRHNIKIPKGKCVLVETKGRTIKLRNDMELWSLVHISNGVTVSVDCERSLNLEINASSKHSKALTVLNNFEHSKRWQLNHGTFPHQSILIWWKDKSSSLKSIEK